MMNTNVTNFRKNIYNVLEQTLKYNEPVNISTKDGNVVVISEADYNSLIETLYLTSNPILKDNIINGLQTPVSGCVPENEVEW